MTIQLATLFDQLQGDPWRVETGFNPDLATAEHDMVACTDDQGVVKILGGWLGQNQPCLFGKIAAKRNLIEYCVLREADFLGSDDRVHSKIKEARLRYIRRGWNGEASAFVIVLLSHRLSRATPGLAVQSIARRLLFLYLGCEIELDKVYLEELFLEVPNRQRNAWKWAAGINYFSAQGDKRWWQDHRIPAAMAFSVNSVGHMVKSGAIFGALNGLNELLGLEAHDALAHNIDSLGKALGFAMRTIDQASPGPSGRATTLLLRSENEELSVPCPIELTGALLGKNYCEYRGLYHTDITLPHEYFLPDVERPANSETHRLDFTYLFHESIENPDHTLMGSGLQIRDPSAPGYEPNKRDRANEVEMPIEQAPLLREALGI